MSKLAKFFKNSKKIHDDDQIEAGRLLSDDTPFAISEAYTKISTSIMYTPSPNKCKTIVITSAMPGEGKSILAINLAISLAKLSGNGKVLLIDSDMRKSRINRLLVIDGEGNKGLYEYLSGIDDMPQTHKVNGYDNLFLLNAGAKTSNPMRFIASVRLSEMLEKFSGEYDYIIIDTPPVGVVADALLYSSVVDGYILSVRADYSNTNLIKDAITSINGVGGNVYGVVLNSFNPKRDKRNSFYAYGKY